MDVISNLQMVVGYENELAKVLEELVAEKEKRVKHEENEMKLQRDFKVRLLYFTSYYGPPVQVILDCAPNQCSTKLVAPVAPPPGLSDLIISRKSIMISRRSFIITSWTFII